MNRANGRVIDANLNRAREGLRVLEDVARFVLDDKNLTESIRLVRHELSSSTKLLAEKAAVFRDTPGDVGTTLQNAGRLERANARDLVVANARRVGEAVRVIEEFAKLEAPEVGPTLESIRYRHYEIERRLLARFSPGRDRMRGVRLYLILTEAVCRANWQETLAAAIRGGVDAVQLREKSLEGGELLRRAKVVVEMCRAANIVSIINDRPDVALLANADGVHVGRGDLPVAAARAIVGAGRIVGTSTHGLEHAIEAERAGADYVGIGPVLPSRTKPRDFVAGLDAAKAVADGCSLPAFAIAGITAASVLEVMQTGVCGVALSEAICGAEDVESAAREMKSRLTQGEPDATHSSELL